MGVEAHRDFINCVGKLRDDVLPVVQVAQAIGLMDALGIEKAIFIGNSAGGNVALQTALAHPERTTALILVGATVYGGSGAPGWLLPLFKTPQIDHLGPLSARWLESQGERLLELAWHFFSWD